MSEFPRRWGINLYQKVTGRCILQAFDELLRTQWLSRDELFALQGQKLQALLDYSNLYIPYYRRLFKNIGFEPADLRRDPQCFKKIPILNKSVMGENPDDFITTCPARQKTIQTHSTSGSTGHPFIFWEDYSYRDHVTADILRHLTWSGWKFGESHAYLWGVTPNPPFGRKMRNALMNFSLNRFVSDACVLSEESMRDFARRIQRRRPKLLFGYASSLFHFARFVQEEGLPGVKFRGIFSSAEVLYPQQKRVIEEAFDCKVFNRYGTLETGGVACECEGHTALHVSVENVLIEILNGDTPVSAGELGEVVITNLNNYGFPFIRYRLGDLVRMSRRNSCLCKRQHPMLEMVEGRQVDLFRTKDGRTVWSDFYSTMFEVEGIKQYQMIQKSLDFILVRLVTNGNFEKSQLGSIELTIRQVMGPGTQVRFEFLDSIPLGSSGKFRYAFSEVSAAQSHLLSSQSQQV
jgi:phenylacetate-CoA ligase